MQIFSRFASGRRTSLAAKVVFALGAACVLTDREAQAQGAGDVPEVGIWIDHEGKGAIEIKPCGPALCGNIVWLKNPVNDQGEQLFDRRNPDATKRNRPICGLPVIGNLRRMTDGWDEGWIYSPEEGSQYDVALKAASRDKLVVTGYKGVKLFSKTFTWTRAPADFQKCNGATESKAKPPAPPVNKAAIGKDAGHKDAAPKAAAAPPPKKPAPANAAGATVSSKQPAVKPAAGAAQAKAVPTDAKKKPAATSQAKAAAIPAKKQPAAAAPSAKPGDKPTAAKKAPAAAPAKKAADAGTSAIVAPKPTAAKKPAAATAAADPTGAQQQKKAAAKPPADKAPAKKQTAEEAEASTAEY